jgi:hypothetical protein
MKTGSGSRRNDETGSATVARTAWTTTPADYNIQVNDPTDEGRCSRKVVIATPGTLVYLGADGVSVTLPSGPGEWTIQMQALVAAGTTAQGVVVHW